MKLYVDQESDALYFRLDPAAIASSQEVRPGVILDLDLADHVIGVEILEIAKTVRPDVLNSVQFESR